MTRQLERHTMLNVGEKFLQRLFKKTMSTKIVVIENMESDVKMVGEGIPRDSFNFENYPCKLLPGEAEKLPCLQKVHNNNHYHFYEFRIVGSVIPKIIGVSMAFTLWTIGICYLYLIVGIKGIAIQSSVINVLSIVVGLLLVFRTNTSYDRYYEARKLWADVKTRILSLAVHFYISPTARDEHDENAKLGSLNLLMAYAISIKHHLRNEKGIYYDDLYALLAHLPEFQPGRHNKNDIDNIPYMIYGILQGHIKKLRETDQIENMAMAQLLTQLTGLMATFSSLERIRNTPLPLAYSIHLRQTVMLYLATLPFQLVGQLQWVTVGIVALGSFTLLGIESIGIEIEQPFGYDLNDLRQDVLCGEIRDDLVALFNQTHDYDSSSWGKAIDMDNFNRFYTPTSEKKME